MKFITKTKLNFMSLVILLCYSSVSSAVVPLQNQQLKSLIKNVTALHPLVQAAKERLKQASFDAKAKKQPLYNPEISVEYESNVEETSTIGLSQTIDWSNKRRAMSLIGEKNKAVAEAQLRLTKQQVAATFLKKINQYQTSRLTSQLNLKQSSTLDQFVDIAKQRLKAGDISQIEFDLALLAAGEIQMNSAKIQADYFSAETELTAFLDFEKIQIPEISIKLIHLDNTSVEKLLIDHPRIKQLRLKTQTANAQIKLARRQKSADPTLSFNAGKEGDEDIYSLGFSIPLMVRNNFSAEVDTAIANAAAVEQEYRNSYRNILVALKTSKKSLRLTFMAYQNWLKQSSFGLEQRGTLLQKVWKSGDLSTTDYLIQIQQTLDTQISAAQLKADVINTWIDYLMASGQIDSWLN